MNFYRAAIANVNLEDNRRAYYYFQLSFARPGARILHPASGTHNSDRDTVLPLAQTDRCMH